LRKGDLNSILKFSTLFKHLLILRSGNLYGKEDVRVISIIFSYHIYPIDYKLPNLIDSDFELNELSEIQNTDNNFVAFKEDNKSKLKYMNPMKIFKLPLIFAGSNQFIKTFELLNKNVSENDNLNIKYKIIFNYINNLEVGVEIVLQENNSIVIFKFKDRLITVPKLEFYENLIERTIMSIKNEIFLIDLLNSYILLAKSTNKNFQGVSNVGNLKKFVTFKIYSTDQYKKTDDLLDFEPVIILAHDFYNDVILSEVLRYKLFEHTPYNNSNFYSEYLISEDKLYKLANFFNKFFDAKYNKFCLYSHNLSKIDWLFILETLHYLSEEYEIKFSVLRKDNDIISIRVKFDLQKDGSYSYYFEIKDSLWMFRTTLNNLNNKFLGDNQELLKSDFYLDLLSNEIIRKECLYNKNVLRDINLCLKSDILNLSNIINNFSELINDEFKVNIHKYPDLSNLTMAIYLAKYLNSDTNCNPLPSSYRTCGGLFKQII
jgi:hypothetical protein